MLALVQIRERAGLKDRLPPFDQAAERAVIGCCITEPVTRIPEAAMVITAPAYFYDAGCRQIWETICSMEPHEVNIITVASRVKFPNIHAMLSECQDAAFSAANLPAWLEVMQSAHSMRQLIAACTRAIQDAYDTKDAVATLDRAEAEVLKIRPKTQEVKDIRALLSEAASIIEFRAQNWDKITGVSTGLSDLDKMTDGLHQGELIVIAAPPSCGKTALAVNIAVHNALAGLPVAILSAEMHPRQLVVRSICSESRVNFKRISESDLPAMIAQVGRLARCTIHIEPASGFTIGQAIATARRLKQAMAIKLLVVDYIQLLTGVGDSREQQVSSVGRGLKQIASELEIPVIGLSQLNDEGRLRESRAIGMDADSVWTITNDGAWQPMTQPVILRVEKCRDGETGAIPLIFQKTITRFENAAKEPTPDYDRD